MSIFRRISNLLSRSSLDREIEAELKSHVDMRIEDNIALGMSHKDARRDALLKFGNPTATKERVTSVDAALASTAFGPMYSTHFASCANHPALRPPQC
jgi:hypothetical protein